MDQLLNIVKNINSYLSDYILMILLIGTGVFFTIRTGFVQVRCFGEGIKRFSVTFPSRERNRKTVSALSRHSQPQLPLRSARVILSVPAAQFL